MLTKKQYKLLTYIRERVREQDIFFKRHRFPREVICHAVWLYARFTLSYRDVEELRAQRGLR